jgi:acyl CoA:acetate/3-ketoacid CoA transferase alpha subunit
MDDSKLNRLREELKAAKKRRDSWEAKVKDLERRYNEAEKVCVYGIFQAANMTPEQLAELIRSAASGIPRTPHSFREPTPKTTLTKRRITKNDQKEDGRVACGRIDSGDGIPGHGLCLCAGI